MMMRMADTDENGQISKEEFVGYSQQTYADAAGPEDKLFTRDYTEQRVYRDDEPVETVNLDQDQDDYVSMEEAQADWETSFTSLDEDGDGAISEEEWGAVGK